MLLVQPLEEFLKASIGQDDLYRVERIPQFVVTPSLVDEILKGMAGRHDFGSAFAARHHVMSARRDFSFTKHARLGHKIRRANIFSMTGLTIFQL
jgi:hypothetical protein